jgi:RNA polymerase I specific transcription initiation factor RRN3.
MSQSGNMYVPFTSLFEQSILFYSQVLFNELLAVFESTILPTHGITHVPFLVFYFCSLRLSIGENFIEFLWKKIANVKIYNIFRQSCCHYVSSLLIHAHFMPVR